MSPDLERAARRARAAEILGWARNVLRENDRCGVGVDREGRCVVIWPALIDAWIHRPEDHGRYLFTLSRRSTVRDVEHLLEGEDPC